MGRLLSLFILFWNANTWGVDIERGVYVHHVLWSDNVYLFSQSVSEILLMLRLFEAHGLHWKEKTLLYAERRNLDPGHVTDSVYSVKIGEKMR